MKQYWGYSHFRPNQAEIIESVLGGHDTLALLPTGGGKSICYQVPALSLDGICIVVTPLIALMQDQVDNLAKKGIKALRIFSGMTAREIDITLDNAVYGDYSFLYVSPERLRTEIFLERFKKMKISFIAVDEAHCISQWGYDFRPAYLKIAHLREINENITVLALTATATPDVAKDIQAQLHFKNANIFKSSFERPNLKYITLKSTNKLDDVIALTTKLKGSGIIYCATRRHTKMLYQHLDQHGISATFYHAGLDREERQARQVGWMKNDIRVIISTNAFGMGIDKPDVRFVIHFDVPDNIESYFQEAGRAGRDLQSARAILFFDHADTETLREKVMLKFPDIETIKKVYNAFGNHFQLAIGSGKDSLFNFNLAAFSEKYNLNLYTTYNAIKLLENSQLVKLNDSGRLHSRLKILVNKMGLYQYQVKSKAQNQVIQFILRSHLGVFDDYLNINEATISRKVNLPIEKIKEILTFLSKQQVVDYVPTSKGYELVYLTERLNDQNFSLPKKAYKAKKEAAEKSVASMLDFLENKTCRQKFILRFFGETSSHMCGQCNVCLGIKKNKLPKALISEVEYQITKELSKKMSVKTESVFASFPEHDPIVITEVIQWLHEHKKINLDASNRVILLTENTV